MKSSSSLFTVFMILFISWPTISAADVFVFVFGDVCADFYTVFADVFIFVFTDDFTSADVFVFVSTYLLLFLLYSFIFSSMLLWFYLE